MTGLTFPQLPAVLRNPNFLRLWLSRAIATCGASMTFIVLPLAVFDLTGSAAALAMSLAGQTATVVLLSPLGGFVADRWSRRRLIVGADLARAAILCGLMFVGGRSDLWIAYACAAGATAAATLMRPAYAAIVPELVAPEDLQQANMLNGLVGTISGTVMPIVGVAAYGLFGLQGVVAGTAVSLVAAAALVARLRVPNSVAPSNATSLGSGAGAAFAAMARDLATGVAVTRGSAALRRLAVGAGLSGFGHGAIVACLVPFLRDGMGLGTGAYGAALATMSVSGVIANLLLVGRFAKVDPIRLYRAGLPWAGPLLLALALMVHRVEVAFVLLALYGAASVLPDASSTTLLQQHSPAASQGRVFAVGDLLFHVFLFAGSLSAGFATEVAGPVAGIALAGGTYVLWAGVGLTMFHQRHTMVPLPVPTPAVAIAA